MERRKMRNATIGIKNTVGFALLLCRLVGMYPVQGLTTQKKRELRFKIISSYAIPYSLTWIGQTAAVSLSIYRMSRLGPNSITISHTILTVNSFAAVLLLFISARVWPKFAREVTDIEKTLPLITNKRLKIKCRAITIVVLSLCLFEVIFMLLINLKQISACSGNNVFTETYFTKFAPLVFEVTSYSLWKAICVTVYFTQFVVASNLTDIIVMIVSIYLTTYFERFGENFSIIMGKSQAQWEIIRKQHSYLLRLTRLTDEHFNGFILLSFGKNLAHVCIQLLGLFRKVELQKNELCAVNSEQTRLALFKLGWFLFSFLFLTLRCGFAIFLTARLNAVAQRITLKIYEMPDVTCYKEARRLVAQTNASTIALSGSQFFYVTRGTILTMVASLITYELVLLQFTH